MLLEEVEKLLAALRTTRVPEVWYEFKLGTRTAWGTATDPEPGTNQIRIPNECPGSGWDGFNGSDEQPTTNPNSTGR